MSVTEPTFAEKLAQLLIDVAQLLDGWHNDGTAWSEWDESVRRRVMEMMIEIDSIHFEVDRP